MDHILVTGATGFIGKHLIRFLSNQPGINIWGISKNGGELGEISIDSVDLTSRNALFTWCKNKPVFKAVFHLAAEIPSSFADADSTFYANQSINYNITSLAIAHKSVLIYASSSSIYGTRANTPFNEKTALEPDNWYSLSKYIGELMGGVASQQHGIKAVSLRISAPYGPGQKNHTVIRIFLEAALNSKDLTLYGTGSRVQDFTYIEDVVRAMWLSYQRKATGVYNIASGHPISMRDLAEKVLSIVPHTKSKICYSGKPDPQENYRGVFSIEEAQRNMGYIPRTSLEDGLKAVLGDLTVGFP